MSEALAPPPPKRLVDPTITLGAMLQVGVLIVGFMGYLLTNSGRVENTAEQVKRLETQVASQAVQTRDSIRESVARVESVVANLQQQVGQMPTVLERVRQLDDHVKRLEERDLAMQRYLDERRAIADARFLTVETRVSEAAAGQRELRAALDGMQRASGVNLPGSPGLRR